MQQLKHDFVRFFIKVIPFNNENFVQLWRNGVSERWKEPGNANLKRMEPPSDSPKSFLGGFENMGPFDRYSSLYQLYMFILLTDMSIIQILLH